MSTYTQERETEQIVGTLTGIVHKGEDKYQAVVMPDGSQYTKNLWTKDQNMVAYLSSQIGNRIAFLCNASHWQRQDGQSVRSLWIDQVGPPAPGSPAMQGPAQAQVPQPQSAVVQPQVVPVQTGGQWQAAPAQSYNDDPKQGKIHRQTATKVAAQLLPYLPEGERNLATLFTLSERLVAYYDDGLPNAQTVEDLMQRAMPQSMEGSGAPMPNPDAPQFTGDDDIPF